MSESTSPAVDVAVIGGGASGALVAWHLLGDATLRVALIEPRAQVAQGTAYATARGEHLLNVNAARMSAFDATPDDFLQFLQTQPEAQGRETASLATGFAPRRVYGRYLAGRLAAHPNAGALARWTDTVVDIAPVAQGLQLTLASGQILRARAAVLATGNLPAALPLPRGATPPGHGVVEAWDYAGVAAIDPGADVGIVGAGLSMVDVVLTLHANGHCGRITALSRHGLLPLGHAPGTVPQAGGVDALLPLGTRARLRVVRDWVAEATAQGRPWQDVLERLRPQVTRLWTTLSAAEQRRFLRHVVRLWDIHRHRIAPEVAALLATLRERGGFALHAGRVQRIEPGPPLRVHWQPRGGAPAETLAVDVVVNATGMEKRLARAPGALLPALQARGLVRPGPHDIGIDTTAEGQLVGADGAPVPGLWTLGALRIGSLWESIAMPELRGQAERVAAEVRGALAHAHQG
ncbi:MULTISPECIES: FAD/NAD(P)-binding protein [Luteimonas]|uniref:FAD/NAD(P)-binding protein n=1 Tax=Luteimonas TaxID=83614 RepID=UPI001E2E80D1|nr:MULTISPECIES: FAD-dependent oxidoreductase [Luteimonas]